MEVISVLLVVAAGAAFASIIGRLAFCWENEVLAMATSVVIFGVGGLALVVFERLDMHGLALTLASAILLTFIFVKFNVSDAPEKADQSRFGCFYWASLLVVFTVAGLESWDIADYLTRAYSLESRTTGFYLALGLFVTAGASSMLMFLREYKMLARNSS